MSWRTVVITQRAKLDLQMGYLVIRMDKILDIKEKYDQIVK